MKSQIDMSILDQFSSLLSTLLDEKKGKFCLTLDHLKKLQTLKLQLEKITYVGMIYKENFHLDGDESKQYFGEFQKIDHKIRNFLLDITTNLDLLRIYLLNQNLTKKSAISFLNILCRITFKCEDFSIIYKSTKNDSLNFFSTLEKFSSSNQPSEELLKNIHEDIMAYSSCSNDSKALFIEVGSSPLHPSQKNDCMKYVQNISSMIECDRFLLLCQGNSLFIFHNICEAEGNRLIYENIDEANLVEIGKLFYDLAVEFKEDLFSKKHICSVLLNIKNSLVNHAKQICGRILQKETSKNLQINMNVVTPKDEYFESLMMKMKERMEIQMDGKNLIFPITEYERIAFFIIVDKITLTIFNFVDQVSRLWSYISHILKTLKERQLFLSLLEQDDSKLILMFNYDKNLIYQSREVPSNLKEYLEISSKQNYQIFHSFPEICKNKELPENVQTAFSVLSKTNSVAYESNTIPKFNIVIKRDHSGCIQHFIISFHNIKDSFSKIKDLPLNPLENLQKFAHQILQQNNLPPNLTLNEIINLLKEKSMEKKLAKTVLDSHLKIKESYVSEYVKSAYSNDNSFPLYKKNSASLCYSPERKRNSKNELSKLVKAQLNPEYALSQDDLGSLKDWNFNIIAKKSHAEKLRMTWAMFHSMNFIEKYEINLEVMNKFLNLLLQKYNCRNNPFHNFDHAITVAHGSYFFLKTKILNKYLDETDFFILLLSSLCHDVDHTGRNNSFESASLSKLAMRYHDESVRNDDGRSDLLFNYLEKVLEQHHAATTIKMLCEPDMNFLSNISNALFKTVRSFLISNILATDMKRHFQLLKSFQLKYSKWMENPLEISTNLEDKKLLTGMVVHTVDLSGATKEFSMASIWSKRVSEEFSNQVKEEEKLGIPVTPFMKGLDNLANIAKQEIGFIQVIIKPLWEEVNIFMENSIKECVDYIDDNKKKWEEIFENEKKINENKI